MNESPRLHPLSGGLPLDGRKVGGSIIDAPLPARLVVPLHQHIGAPARPLVTPGDRVLRGQPIGEADGVVSAAVHAASSGTVVAIEPRPVANISGVPALCVVIDTDGEDVAVDPLPALDDTSDPNTLRQRVRDAGIAGLGGAVFPTATKLASAAGGSLQTLIVNGAECEPCISCDDSLIRLDAARILRGAQLLLQALRIDDCIVAVEANMPDASAAFAAALEALDDPRFSLREVPALYPAGGERQLIQVLLGREVPSDGLPVDIGCLCVNTGTAAAVADAVLDGRPLTSRIVTVTGPGVAQPCNLHARVGTPFAELISQAGGYTSRAPRVLMGGMMMGFDVPDDQVPVVKATNCVLVMDAAAPAVRGPALPCIRCGDCAQVCPARLQPQELHRQIGRNDAPALLRLGLPDCIECGCCDVVCPSHIPLTTGFRTAKLDIRRLQRDRLARAHFRARYEARSARLAEQAEKRDKRPTPVDPPAATTDDDPRKAVIAASIARARARRKPDDDA